ncbi:MAG: 2'-5' RNA ligase family protein [Acidobacteriota bacterium]|nr:2'-5' RNA ligase family protein [Acidobacteriota bacterium]
MSSNGSVQYALVAYIRNALGEFVEGLRREVHPPHSHLPTHLTVLPPRPISGSEEEAIVMLRQASAGMSAFQMELGEVESFLPITPTVFIRVAHAGYRMRELHDQFNQTPLAYNEPLPYMPHVTVAKLDDNERAAEVLSISKQRWLAFPGSHAVTIDRLTFVRGREHTWLDLADIPLSAPIR